tara:strand:+ start:301 stop:432 length:132 start_codon:yes stop_codon:yes gene_type:complete
MLEPPVKSIPDLSPGAIARKTTPGAITKKENMKNQILLPAKSK